jgi:hypothetical protein
MTKALFMILFAITAAVAVSPADACSWSYERGYSPEEIKDRTDVRPISGIFRFEEIRGEPVLDGEGQASLLNPEVIGHIERGSGRWNTVHFPTRGFGDGGCTFPATGPEANASGTFWITRRRKGGRYRILLWEGEHLPADQPVTETTN